jgi:hypothetical protein
MLPRCLASETFRLGTCSPLVLALFLAGCSEGEATPAGRSVEDEVTAGTTYAGVALQPVDVDISDEPPDPEADVEGSWVYLDLALESILEDTTVSLPSQLFSLEGPDGQVIRSDGWLDDHPRGLTLEPRESASATLHFSLEEGVDLDGWRVRIEESGRQPAFLALSGDPTSDPLPPSIEIERSRETVTASGPGAAHDVDVEPLEIAASLDWGATRVAAGHYFIIVVTRAYGLTDSMGGTNVFGSMFRLSEDGVIRPTYDFEGPGTLRGGVEQDYTAVFEVPVGTEDLALLVGHFDGTSTTYEIEFEPPPTG